MIPLGRKGCGIRPIAVGHTLRRLAAKYTISRVLHAIANLLAPVQLSCGTSLGCEAAVHATHLYIHMQFDQWTSVVEVDFKIAFNCVRRDQMPMALKESSPELLEFVYSAYA